MLCSSSLASTPLFTWCNSRYGCKNLPSLKTPIDVHVVPWTKDPIHNVSHKCAPQYRSLQAASSKIILKIKNTKFEILAKKQKLRNSFSER